MVLASESWLGERPAEHPGDLVLGAGRVASPKRVHRYSTASPTPMTMTMPAIQKRFTGIWTPNSSMVVLGGRRFGTCLAPVPNHSSTVPAASAGCPARR